MWIRTNGTVPQAHSNFGTGASNAAGDVVYRHQDGGKERSNPKPEKHNHRRLDEIDERIDSGVYLAAVKLSERLKDTAEVARLFAHLRHLRQHAWDFRVLGERVGERLAPLHLRDGAREYLFIDLIVHHIARNLKRLYHRDAACKHGGEVVRDAREIQLLKERADIRQCQLERVKCALPHRRALEAPEEKTERGKEKQD